MVMSGKWPLCLESINQSVSQSVTSCVLCHRWTVSPSIYRLYGTLFGNSTRLWMKGRSPGHSPQRQTVPTRPNNASRKTKPEGTLFQFQPGEKNGYPSLGKQIPGTSGGGLTIFTYSYTLDGRGCLEGMNVRGLLKRHSANAMVLSNSL